MLLFELAIGMRWPFIYLLTLNSCPHPLKRVGQDSPCPWGIRKKRDLLTKVIALREPGVNMVREGPAALAILCQSSVAMEPFLHLSAEHSSFG